VEAVGAAAGALGARRPRYQAPPPGKPPRPRLKPPEPAVAVVDSVVAAPPWAWEPKPPASPPAADVEVRSMPLGGAEFIAALASGQSLAEATMSALGADRSFDLSANLAALIGSGVFVGCCLAAAVGPKRRDVNHE